MHISWFLQLGPIKRKSAAVVCSGTDSTHIMSQLILPFTFKSQTFYFYISDKNFRTFTDVCFCADFMLVFIKIKIQKSWKSSVSHIMFKISLETNVQSEPRSFRNTFITMFCWKTRDQNQDHTYGSFLCQTDADLHPPETLEPRSRCRVYLTAGFWGWCWWSHLKPVPENKETETAVNRTQQDPTGPRVTNPFRRLQSVVVWFSFQYLETHLDL